MNIWGNSLPVKTGNLGTRARKMTTASPFSVLKKTPQTWIGAQDIGSIWKGRKRWDALKELLHDLRWEETNPYSCGKALHLHSTILIVVWQLPVQDPFACVCYRKCFDTKTCWGQARLGNSTEAPTCSGTKTHGRIPWPPAPVGEIFLLALKLTGWNLNLLLNMVSWSTEKGH